VQVLLTEAESKLADAIKQSYMDRVSIAHGLLEVARTRTATATKELGIIAGKRKKSSEGLKAQTDRASKIAADKKPKH
jgi:hypothetical protein